MSRREIYLVIFSVFLILAATVPPVHFAPGEVVAAEPMATPAPPDPPGTCISWMVAGIQMIHKCVDVDEGIVCYQPTGGVMQCLVRN